MAAQPKLRWFCCILISLVSLGSLSIAIALGQYLINETSDGISEAHCEFLQSHNPMKIVFRTSPLRESHMKSSFNSLTLTHTFLISSPFLARLSRGIDGLSLLADIIILIVIFANMLVIRRSSKSLKRSISRLTFIFAAVTLISSLLLIAEIVIIYPSTTQVSSDRNLRKLTIIIEIYTDSCFPLFSILIRVATLSISRISTPPHTVFRC